MIMVSDSDSAACFRPSCKVLVAAIPRALQGLPPDRVVKLRVREVADQPGSH